MKLDLVFDRNFMLYPLTAEIFVDDVFFDYFTLRSKQKSINVTGSKLEIKVKAYTSNSIALDDLEKQEVSKLRISSKIQSGFYLFSFLCFFVSLFLCFFVSMLFIILKWQNLYLGMAFLIPYAILIWKQNFQRKGMITIEKLY